jgi:hypothetical protein
MDQFFNGRVKFVMEGAVTPKEENSMPSLTPQKSWLFDMLFWSWPQLLTRNPEKKQKIRFYTLGTTIGALVGVSVMSYHMVKNDQRSTNDRKYLNDLLQRHMVGTLRTSETIRFIKARLESLRRDEDATERIVLEQVLNHLQG